MENLETKLIAVSVNLDDFKRTVTVRQAKDTVANYYNASRNSVTVSQNLYPEFWEKGLIKKRRRVINFFNKSNSDLLYINGQYLVMPEDAPKILNDIQERVDEYKAEVRAFVSNWDAIMRDAKIERGDMFNEQDYPHPDTIVQKSQEMIPFLQEASFNGARIGVFSAEQINQFQEALSKRVSEDIMSRLVDNLLGLIGALEGKKFDPVHFDKIQKVLDIIDTNSLPQTPEVVKLSRRVKQMLRGVTKDIKHFPLEREKKAQEIKQLVSESMI